MATDSDSDSADIESVGRLERDHPQAIARVISFERGQLAFISDQDDWLTAQDPLRLRDWA